MTPMLLQAGADFSAFTTLTLVGVVVLLFLFVAVFIARRYKRCPSNRVLVVYGRGTGERAAKCLHGGGTFVWPLVQDYAYLSLEPLAIEIELTGALSKKNIRVNVPSTFTIGISTEPEIMNNAAERLLGLNDDQVSNQARDIILGQMRLVLATLAIEEINQDREKFLDLVNKNVGFELNKIGLDVINVNIRDITDESGYIEAIGRKAAAEAVQQARVEVAEQEKLGEIGQATAFREKDVSVANQKAQSAMGQKEAERTQRVSVAKFEAEGVTGEAAAHREKEIAVAEQQAKAVQGQKAAMAEQRIRVAELEAGAAQGEKKAQADQRIKVASFEADAVGGENEAKATIARSIALLAQAQAEAKRTGDVALANANRDVLQAQAQEEQARLEKEQVVLQQIEKRKVEIEAEAIIGASRSRRDIYTEHQREKPRGYARAVEVGDQVFVSGCTSVMPNGEVRAAGDWAAQSDIAHEAIRWALGQAGASLDDVVRRRTFTVEGSVVNRAHGQGPAWFAKSCPSSLGCRISGLARPELVVEVEVAAVKGAHAGIEWIAPDPVDPLDA